MKKLLALIVFFSAFIAQAQYSKTHYIGPIMADAANNLLDQYLYISTPSTSPVHVRMHAYGAGMIEQTITRDNPWRYSLGMGYSQMAANVAFGAQVVQNKGFHIEATDLVNVSYRVNAVQNNHAGNIVSKGKAALGTEFRAYHMSPTVGSEFQGSFTNFITVLATENNTQVQFSDFGNNVFDPLGNLYQEPYVVTLQAGQTYVLPACGPSSANLRAFLGTKISSDKPVAVNAGSFIGTNGEMLNADLGFDQIVPVERTGQEYIFVKSTGHDNVERAFLVANENHTEIYAKGLPTPVATINAGEAYSFYGNDYDFNGNLYVYTSKPTSAYQGIGDGQRGDQANQEMFFVPPLSCETPKNISSIPNIERIGNLNYTGRATLVTKTGSTLQFIINELPFTLAELSNETGVTVTGPLTVQGNGEYVSYVIVGLRGNVSISSSSQLYLASYGTSQAATFGGYYSGFIYKPEITFQSANVELNSCIPHTTLAVNEVNGFDTYQWYVDGVAIAGATQSSFHPTQEGVYKVIAYLTECNTSYESDEIPVSSCGPDYDGDGIIDNLDEDWDGDGLSNCQESYGSQKLDFTALNTQVSWPAGTRTYSHQLISAVDPTQVAVEPTAESNLQLTVQPFTTDPVRVEFTASEVGALEITPINNDNWSSNFDAEYIVRSPNMHHITLINTDFSLVIDTNFDGTYEPFVSQQTGYEIRFKVNTTNGATPAHFRLVMAKNDRLVYEIRNYHESLPAQLILQYTATCLPKDSDLDGVADQWDIDSDNDGIPDYWEQIGHLQPQDAVADANGNGWADFFETRTPTDSDEDGVPNYLDWDADNNGLYDRNETRPNLNYGPTFATAQVNEYGMHPQSGYTDLASVFATIPTDSDNDGISNAFSKDNDGDGCWDTLENSIPDADRDGVPGSGQVQVNGNGLINGFSYANYTVDELINDPQPLVVQSSIEFPMLCLNQTASLAIEVEEGVSIQWQKSENGVDFTDLTETNGFGGVQSTVLHIAAERVNADLANWWFRIQLTNPNAPCTDFSQHFQLQIQSGSVELLTEFTQCEADVIADGITTFDLDDYAQRLTNGANGIEVSWYASQADMDNNQAITGIWTNQTNPQTLLMAVNDEATACAYTQAVTFRVAPTALTTLAEWKICEPYQNATPGQIAFDLTAAAQQLIGVGTYTFHLTIDDALANRNAIADPQTYRNTLAYTTEEIFVRKGTNWSSCEGLYLLPLRVLALPPVDANLEREPVVICSPTTVYSTTLHALTDASQAGLYTYKWYKDGQLLPYSTEGIAINSVGEYHVVVRSAEGCEVTRYLPVIHSSLAVVDEVIITDFLDPRTVQFSLELPAYGQYEYSIDSPSAFQAVPYFEGLAPGRHILYINDKLGCGITAYPIYVLGIPPFFTPNGDGFNDYWNAWGDDPQDPRIKTLHIFDRFGKLLAELDPRGAGWDGKLQGNLLPSTDYWYRIETFDGKIVRGHFTLKR